MSTYLKAIVACLTAIATWGVTAASDGSFSAIEWFGLIGAIAAAIGVYAAPNKSEGA